MNRNKSLITVVVFYASLCMAADVAVPSASQPTHKSELVALTLKTGAVIVGENKLSSGPEFAVIDLTTGKEMAFKQDELLKPVKDISEAEAITMVGLAPFVSWKTRQVLADSQQGQIAEVTPSGFFLTVGGRHGIESGHRLDVFREDRELKDPATGRAIGTIRSRIAVLEVVDVQPEFAKARLVGDLDINVKVGDIVSAARSDKAIAVLPLPNSSNEADPDGTRIAEGLITRLVQDGVQVVERTRLSKALEELLLQQSPLFDNQSAQKLGRQMGAYAVLAGTVTPAKGADAKTGEAHLRLIKVDTGKVLFACTSRFRTLGSSAAVDGSRPSSTGIKARLAGTRWRYKGGRSIMSYHENGTVSCNDWNEVGRWYVENDNTITQQNPRWPTDRYTITFSDDFKKATWVRVGTTGRAAFSERIE